MDLSQFYQTEKLRAVNECRVCGLCAQKCPIISQTEIADVRPDRIQRAVLDFLTRGTDSPILRERIQSCMKCYGCIDICPQDLNPLRTLEICTAEMAAQRKVVFEPWEPKSPDLVHRVLARIQTTAQEYERIFTPSAQRQAHTVFFPGCNVYFQPDKLLNALDIMARIDDQFAFVPGLDVCCGNCHLIRGGIQPTAEAFAELVDTLIVYQPETVVLWCPTCFCLADTTFGPIMQYPFKIQSMAQYVTDHVDKLDIVKRNSVKITVHDACKLALTGLDVNGSRPILEALGADIVEMPRIGRKAACCGCAAVENYPAAGIQMLDDRIAEAVQTGAEVLATVCHFCNQVLASRHHQVTFSVESYINLLANSLGINREDKFRKYMRWANAERILADAAPYIKTSPFPFALIERTVKDVFQIQ